MTAKVAAVLVLLAAPQAAPPEIPAGKFEKLHALIRPQAGELRWREIPWLTSIQEAREKAAREGKPVLLWAAADGHPLGRN